MIITDNNNIIWFNAKQICISLEYKYPKDAIINNVEKHNKNKLKNINIDFKIKQHPDSIYINENGLYSLLIISKTEKSKKMIEILYKEINPIINKNHILEQ